MRPDYDIMINGISNQTPGLSSIIILQHSDQQHFRGSW